eukprot:g15376.t1
MSLTRHSLPVLYFLAAALNSSLSLDYFLVRVAAIPDDWLNCETDPEWGGFRRLLMRELQSNDMVPTPKLVEAASAMLATEDFGKLQPDPGGYMGYAPAMQAFLNACNQQEQSTPPGGSSGAGTTSLAVPSPTSSSSTSRRVCLYGVVSALWVLAYAQWGSVDADRMLEHAKFLLGSHTRYCLDFIDATHWTVSSLDIMAQKSGAASAKTESTPAGGSKNGAGGLVAPAAPFRNPVTLPPVMVPARPIELDRQQPPESETSKPLVVWEIGVHASLSAEPLNLWASFVTGKFQFANLIEDQYPAWLPDKWTTLYGEHFDRERNVDAGPAVRALQELFRAHIPHSASSKDPVPEYAALQSSFREIMRAVEAGDVAAQKPDILLCTILVLCFLPEQEASFGVIGYFGHPMLFMVSEAQRADVFRQFRELHDGRGKFAFSVSDPFLQMQYEYQTDVVL